MRKTSTAIRIDKRPSDGVTGNRRRYQSQLRQDQTEQTRTRILKAGSYLAHRLKDWDWSKLTARVVAARANVSERTVYRHFATERELQEAILRRLEEEAGIAYETIKANELLTVTERIYASLPKFAASLSVDGTSASVSEQRRQAALLRVLSELAPARSEKEHRMASAVIDLIWTPHFYEHLVVQWKMDSAMATRTAVWAIEMLTKAIRDGEQSGKKSDKQRKAIAKRR